MFQATKWDFMHPQAKVKNINVFCTVIADRYKGMVLKPQCLVQPSTLWSPANHQQTSYWKTTVYGRLLSSFLSCSDTMSRQQLNWPEICNIIWKLSDWQTLFRALVYTLLLNCYMKYIHKQKVALINVCHVLYRTLLYSTMQHVRAIKAQASFTVAAYIHRLNTQMFICCLHVDYWKNFCSTLLHITHCRGLRNNSSWKIHLFSDDAALRLV